MTPVELPQADADGKYTAEQMLAYGQSMVEKRESQNDPAVAAIEYAIKTDEGIQFLRCWLHGEFPEIRAEWTDCPDECFIGADPLLSPEG